MVVVAIAQICRVATAQICKVATAQICRAALAEIEIVVVEVVGISIVVSVVEVVSTCHQRRTTEDRRSCVSVHLRNSKIF